jgi:hypothetical protein
VGSTYHVLEVVQDTRGRWLFRAVGDGANGVALFSLEQFEIVSTKIPGAWIPIWNTSGGFALTTESWAKAGFWEAYYEQEPVALQMFENERSRIVDADP